VSPVSKTVMKVLRHFLLASPVFASQRPAPPLLCCLFPQDLSFVPTFVCFSSWTLPQYGLLPLSGHPLEPGSKLPPKEVFRRLIVWLICGANFLCKKLFYSTPLILTLLSPFRFTRRIMEGTVYIWAKRVSCNLALSPSSHGQSPSSIGLFDLHPDFESVLPPFLGCSFPPVRFILFLRWSKKTPPPPSNHDQRRLGEPPRASLPKARTFFLIPC